MRTLVTRVNPLVLLVVGTASVFASLGVRELSIACITICVYVLAVVCFTPSLRYALVCLAFALFAGLTVAWSTWRLGGGDVEVAVTAALRIVVLAWPGSVVAGYIDPIRLGDYLGQSVRLPARAVVATTGALQQVGQVMDAWAQIGQARRARGLPDRGLARIGSIGPRTFALFVSSLRAGAARSIAMDARGFATAQHRTWAEPAPWSGLDVAGVVLGVGMALVPVTLMLI